MTEQEIKSNNKLIAEFMGYVYFEPDVLVDYSDCGGIYDKVDVYSKVPIEVKDYGEGQKYFKKLPNPDFGNENTTRWRSDLEELDWDTLNSGNYITDLKYHYSWDSLMPVVHKCCADLRELGFDKRGSWHPKHGYVSDIYVMGLDNPIEKVYAKVINHIKRFKK